MSQNATIPVDVANSPVFTARDIDRLPRFNYYCTICVNSRLGVMTWYRVRDDIIGDICRHTPVLHADADGSLETLPTLCEPLEISESVVTSHY